MLHIKLKGIPNAATWLLVDTTSPPHDPGVGVIRSKYSEHGHVAYHIRENQECSSMVTNILLTDSWGWGLKVNIQLFQNMDMLHGCL